MRWAATPWRPKPRQTGSARSLPSQRALPPPFLRKNNKTPLKEPTMSLDTLRDLLPAYAKDLSLNLSSLAS